ncbi:LOW QUALITY PROTEIN: X-box-binding protein 1 [Alosa sapidissima]|uniref:LOW QUALITY PROTEIN: X-box-binding protein 1 n=1 Tax=Alosa sapidissima TaxID=34773 RepID=UPI001C0955FD|nr:LOW QUALITY PROTEIN: X-box-binding protein 1 [Alosa sapidissima]
MVVVTAGTGGAHKVLLISGKQNASSTTATQGGFNRSISVVLPSSQVSSDSDSNGSGPPLRKRQRLTHLSPEEKALRRKLKNRVAAQTARDRKKAKMGELEQQVLELELENQQLNLENRLLREKTSDLITENEELRQRLGLDTLEVEKVQVLESNVSSMGLGIGSSERSTQATCASAAGAGPAVLKSEEFAMDTGSPGSSDAESDLLLGILDILDPELFLKGALAVPQEAQLVLGGGEGVPVCPAAPAALGPAPVKLEATNELIHFDHIYTKPVEEVVCVEDEEEDEVEVQESVQEVKLEDQQEEMEDKEEELEEEAFSLAQEEVVACVEDVSVKDEPEEVHIPEVSGATAAGVIDDFLSPASPSLAGYGKTAYLTDAYSDSGYERSPSPFSNMSSPLCSESSWEDVFANELFPQLISV